MNDLIEITPLTVGNVWKLLKNFPYDSLIDAAIHGYHGTILADHIMNPTVVSLEVGGTYYIAGDVNSPSKDSILKSIKPYAEINAEASWKDVVWEHFSPDIITRTRFDMDGSALDLKTLKNFANQTREEYWIEAIDESVFHQLLNTPFTYMMVANFKDYKDFAAHGLGYVIFKDDEIVSGASSFIRYNQGIEVEIATHKDYRNQGLATWIGAMLIAEGLERNLDVHWDAANETSKRLAERLGYSLKRTYEILNVTR